MIQHSHVAPNTAAPGHPCSRGELSKHYSEFWKTQRSWEHRETRGEPQEQGSYKSDSPGRWHRKLVSWWQMEPGAWVRQENWLQTNQICEDTNDNDSPFLITLSGQLKGQGQSLLPSSSCPLSWHWPPPAVPFHGRGASNREFQARIFNGKLLYSTLTLVLVRMRTGVGLVFTSAPSPSCSQATVLSLPLLDQ